MFDPHAVRRFFPFFSQADSPVYLDSAASSQKLGTMIDTLAHFYRYEYAPVHRSIYVLGEEATQRFETTRAVIAQWLEAQSEEIVFTHSTTHSINLIAQAWAASQLQAGDEIVLTELEHHANIVPWQRLAQEKKLVLRWIPVTAQGILEDDKLEQYITAKTKLVAVTHSSNTLGTYVDVKKIAARAHAVGARVLIDAAQSAPHERLSVTALDCDFLVFSVHKMAGPNGVGILYIKKDLHDQLAAVYSGGSAVYAVSYEAFHMRPMPHFLEPGTPAIAEVIATGTVFEFLNGIDFDALQKYEAQLCASVINRLSDNKKIQLHGPLDQLTRKGHLVSFSVVNMHAHDVAAYLASKNICVRAGHQCAQPLHEKLKIGTSVRASFYMYTAQRDVDLLCTALEEL